MDEKNIVSINRLLFIIALFLGVLSLILPWGQITIGAFGKVDFYSWGISGISILGYADPTTEMYISFLFNEDFINLLSETNNFYGYLVPMILGVLVLPLVVIGLFLGSLSVFNIRKKEVVYARDAGIVLLISVILYYFFMQFGLLTLLNSSYIAFTNFFSYTVDYVIIIFSMIMIFGAYILLKMYSGSGEKNGKVSDNTNAMKLLKQRYVKGEISKDEFDQMKKDIE